MASIDLVADDGQRDPKIVDLIAAHKGPPWVAFEFFPPRTESGTENLKARFPRMKNEGRPLYCDITVPHESVGFESFNRFN